MARMKAVIDCNKQRTEPSIQMYQDELVSHFCGLTSEDFVKIKRETGACTFYMDRPFSNIVAHGILVALWFLWVNATMRPGKTYAGQSNNLGVYVTVCNADLKNFYNFFIAVSANSIINYRITN